MGRPQLDQGILHLDEASLEQSVVEFNGEAIFYHSHFLTASQIGHDSIPFNYILLSHSWNDQPEEYLSYPRLGYGTYYFKIHLPQSMVGRSFILRPNDYISYASQLFVNGVECAGSGQVAMDVDDAHYEPSRNIRAHAFQADSCVLDVVIWVSNFHHYRGGVIRPITVGLEQQMNAKRERAILIDLVIIMSLFIMFLYHIILFVVNRKAQASFAFAVLCLLLSVDFTFRGAMTYFLIFPDTSFAFYNTLHLIAPYMVPGVFVLFLHIIFPNQIYKPILHISMAIGVVVTLATVLGSQEMARFVLKPFYIFTSLIIIYGVVLMVKMLRNRVYASVLFAVAYLIFGLSATNDLLDMFEIVQTRNMLAPGTIIFIFLMSILYGKQTDKMNREVVDLTTNLKQLNKGLENQVKERTQQLDASIEALQKLNAFQEGMTHMVAHELKNPLMQIIHVDFLKEGEFPRLRESGTRMLNMIQNMIDIYRFNNENVVLQKSAFDVYACVEDVVQEYLFFAQKRAVKIELIQYQDYQIEADMHMFKQIISNLLSNALRHTPNNGLIQIRIGSEEPGCILVSVSNEGASLSQEELEGIFSRTNKATVSSEEYKTSGLGLSLCRMAVEEHEGSIGAMPDGVLDGVRFWFEMPGVSQESSVKKYFVKEDENEVNLSDADQAYLLPFALRIADCEVFEATKIDMVMKEISCSNEQITNWYNNIETACYQIDDAKLKETLAYVIKS